MSRPWYHKLFPRPLRPAKPPGAPFVIVDPGPTYPAIPEEDSKRWFDGKQFTTDWTSGRADMWATILKDQRDRAFSILEIGSFEGRSTIIWVNLLPLSHITCVDTWDFVPGSEGRFDKNLAEYTSRLRRMKGDSRKVLEQLNAEGASFDLVYIDGNHDRDPVLRDSVLAWQMLRIGGFAVWDDYLFGLDYPPHKRPKEAIDFFLKDYADEIEVLHRGYQVAVRRHTSIAVAIT
jgi:predicted O-methyltransferase YrrM